MLNFTGINFISEINQIMEFSYQEPFPILKDDTQYKKVSSDFVKVEKLGDREIL